MSTEEVWAPTAQDEFIAGRALAEAILSEGRIKRGLKLMDEVETREEVIAKAFLKFASIKGDVGL